MRELHPAVREAATNYVDRRYRLLDLAEQDAPAVDLAAAAADIREAALLLRETTTQHPTEEWQLPA